MPILHFFQKKTNQMFVVYKKCITFALGNNKTQRFKKIDYAKSRILLLRFLFLLCRTSRAGRRIP